MKAFEGFALICIIATTIGLVVRWRGRGALISIPFGYVAILLLNTLSPHATWNEVEFAEDWPFSGLIIMPLWCLFLLGIMSLGSLLKKIFKRDEPEY